MRFGTDILRQADVLAAFTEDPPRLTRTYLTPMHRRAGDTIAGWMREAGMTAGYDALGNVVGRYEAATPGAPTLMTGSHMDSVRDAGRYDGLFGILTAIACVRDLNARGKRLPFAFEIVAFGDEEGVRFGVTLTGSKSMGGSFDPRWLDAKDADGVTLREALVAFGGDPDGWPALDRRGKGVFAYVESHIEQGPVLLDEGLPVGVVTAIAGGYRVRVSVTGLAGHAGTVPMGARRDALAAASEMVLAVERIAREAPARDAVVATVGKLEAKPGAINVIPQDVDFTIDVRSGDDAARKRAMASIRVAFDAIAAAPRRAGPCRRLLRTPGGALRAGAAGRARRVDRAPGRAGAPAAVGRGARRDGVPAGVPDRDAVRALRQRRHQPPSVGDDDRRGRRGRDRRAARFPRARGGAMSG